MELSNVKNPRWSHFGDDSDLQFDDERLVCPWIDVPVNELQFNVIDNVKVMHEDINNLKSHLEYIRETFQTIDRYFIIPQ